MKIIENKIIPFPGYKAINLFGVLFVRKGAKITQKTLNHESIHTAQMRELLYIGFYIIYFFEWLYRLFWYLDGNDKAYSSISFEVEAYNYEAYDNYLENRKPFAQWRS
jgi:hypothetical protein